MNNNSYTAVTIQNVDSEDFVFEYNRAAGNPPYLIKTGEIVTYPNFLAKHAVKHLITKILNKRDISTSNPVEREKLASEIVVKEEAYQRASSLTPDQQLQKDILTMNKAGDLESILEKRKAEKEKEAKRAVETPAKSVLPEVDTTEEDEKFEGLTPKPDDPPVPDDGVVKEVMPETKKPHTPAPMPDEPTRKELYDYAKNTLKMDMNKKTLNKLDKMEVIDVVAELDYPLKENND